MLSYLSTTIITLHSLSHILAQKAAHDRSLAAPVFGLEEQQEGILVGKTDHSKGQEHVEGLVIEMEHRRKSGRGVVEWYFLPPASRYSAQEVKEVITLLEDHPLYRRPEDDMDSAEQDEPGSTFELKLTERQRRDREGVVLPYFDAQSGDGPVKGGAFCMIWERRMTLTRKRMRFERKQVHLLLLIQKNWCYDIARTNAFGHRIAMYRNHQSHISTRKGLRYQSVVIAGGIVKRIATR